MGIILTTSISQPTASGFRPQQAAEAPRRKQHELSRAPYFTSRCFAVAGFGGSTERFTDLHTHATQRSYRCTTPGRDGLRRADIGATDAGIHHPDTRAGPEWTRSQRSDWAEPGRTGDGAERGRAAEARRG